MDAKEFVKDCGIEVAKRTLNNAIGFGCAEIDLFGGKYVFRTDDLKTLVDAWEFVEKFGGMFHAKVTLEKEGFTGGIELDDELIEDVVLKQAIKLVEQCQ